MSWMQKNYNPSKHHLFIPTNVEKYGGSLPIVLRSKLELTFARWCDRTSAVLWWVTEPIGIPYIHPFKVDKKTKKLKTVRYYPDFAMKVRSGADEKFYIVEIKPEKETKLPKYSKRKSMLNEQRTYQINIAKWKACLDYCNRFNCEFKIITEKGLC